MALASAGLLTGVYGMISGGTGYFGQGYEATYVAAAEGIFRIGEPKLVDESPLYDAALGGTPRPASGQIYPGPTVGWGGPVTALGITAPAMVLDELYAVFIDDSVLFRKLAGLLFRQLLTVLAALLVFWAALMLYDSTRRAVLLALAFGLASIAFPYVKIGMEPPLMFWTTAMLAAIVATRKFPERRLPWLALGLSAGMAAATRMPVAPLLIAPFISVPFLVSTWGRSLDPNALIRFALVCAPFLVSVVLSGVYNEVRCESLVCIPDTAGSDLQVNVGLVELLEAFYGLLLSPGKSFFLTTPLAVLGAIGAVRAWRSERVLVLTVVTGFVFAVAVVSPLSYWSDEIYGPRYLVYLAPAAVLLSGLGLGWGQGQTPLFRSRFAQRWVVASLVALGAMIQFVAVVPERGVTPCVEVRALVGPERFDQDLCRFVPPLSDVVMNARMTLAVAENMIGTARDIEYEAFVGPPGGDRPMRWALSGASPELQRPSFFWARDLTLPKAALLVMLAGVAMVSIVFLRRSLGRGSEAFEEQGESGLGRSLAEDHIKPLDRFIQYWRFSKVKPYIAEGDRILDVGCADGALLRRYEDRIGEGIGIDAKLIEPVHGPTWQLVPGHFPADLSDAKPFDVIVMLAVLEHVPRGDQRAFVARSISLLKPGGHLVLTVPSPIVDRILAVLGRLRLIEGMSLEQHYGFHPHEVPSLFSDNKLLVVRDRSFQFGLNNLFVFRRQA